jgi:hypothetical protein
VAQQGTVNIKVYNVEGKEVSNVFSGVKSAGTYDLPFNGARLSPGVYICRMLINNKILLQQKLIIER